MSESRWLKLRLAAGVKPTAADIRRWRDKGNTSALVALLRHKDSGVRTQAAVALGETGDEAAVEPLIAALTSGHGRMERVAARALGQLGEGAEKVLRVIADDPARDPIERERAKLGLEMLEERRAEEHRQAAAEERRRAAEAEAHRKAAEAAAAESADALEMPVSGGHVALIVSGPFLLARTTAGMIETLGLAADHGFAGVAPVIAAQDGANVEVRGVFQHISRLVGNWILVVPEEALPHLQAEMSSWALRGDPIDGREPQESGQLEPGIAQTAYPLAKLGEWLDSEAAPVPVTREEEMRIDEAITNAWTWGSSGSSEWVDFGDEKPNEPARFLAEAGDEAVPGILATLQGCAAAGACPDGRWDGAPELCHVLARIGTDEAKRALVAILNTESRVVEWEWARAAAAAAIGELKDESLIPELSAASNRPGAPARAIEEAIAALGGSPTEIPEAFVERGWDLAPQEADEYFAAKADEISGWTPEDRAYLYFVWASKVDELKGRDAALPYYAAALAADPNPDQIAWSKAFPEVSPSAEAAAELASKHPLPPTR